MELLAYSAKSIAQMPVPVPTSRTRLRCSGNFTSCNSPSNIRLVQWCIISSLAVVKLVSGIVRSEFTRCKSHQPLLFNLQARIRSETFRHISKLQTYFVIRKDVGPGIQRVIAAAILVHVVAH